MEAFEEKTICFSFLRAGESQMKQKQILLFLFPKKGRLQECSIVLAECPV